MLQILDHIRDMFSQIPCIFLNIWSKFIDGHKDLNRELC